MSVVAFIQKIPATVLASCILALVLLALYARTLHSPLHYDSQINLNPDMLRSILPRFNFLKNFFIDPRGAGWATLILTFKYFGLNTFLFHLQDLLLHFFNSILIFIFLKKIFGDCLSTDKNFSKPTIHWLAFFAALFFALNPVGVYVVTNVIQRFVLFAVFFSLLAILSWRKALVEQRVLWFWISAPLYYLAMQGKEQAVTLPAVFMLLVFLLRKPDKKLWRDLLPPLFVCALMALWTVVANSHLMGIVYEPLAQEMIQNSHATADIGTVHELLNDRFIFPLSILNQLWLFFRYLYLWLIPDVSKMAVDLPISFIGTFFSIKLFLGFFLFAALMAMGFLGLKKRGTLGLAGFGLLVAQFLFLSECSTVRYHEIFVLYRSYLWMIFIFAILPLLVAKIPAKWRWSLLGLATLIFFIASWERAGTFLSELKLWEDAAYKTDKMEEVSPVGYRTYGNVATALGGVGRYAEAFKYYQKAAELNPVFVKAWDGMGASMGFLGRDEEAIPYLKKAIEIEPRYRQSYFNLGTVFARLGRNTEAVEYLKKAVELDPDYSDALYNLATTLQRIGKDAEAFPLYEHILKLNPGNLNVLYNEAVVHLKLKRQADAIACLKRILELDPNFSPALELKRQLGLPGSATSTSPPK